MARFVVIMGTVNLGGGKVAAAGEYFEAPLSMSSVATVKLADEMPTREVQAASIIAEEVQPVHHEWKRKRK